jgi:hypothetical protein
MGPGRSDDPRVELEVFPTGRTRAEFPIEWSDHEPHTDIAARLRDGGSTIREWIDRAELHSHPGPRIGAAAVPTTSARLGDGADIVRPVLINPNWASELATSGVLFAERVDHLEIDTAPGADRRYLVWSARLDIGTRRPFQASLHLLASTSMLVTVLELVPQRRTRRHRERFVDVGVVAIDELASRLQRAKAGAVGAPR